MKSSSEETSVTVEELFDELGVELGLGTASGKKGFNRKITSFEVLKPRASLNTDQKGKVKVLGRAELKRLGAMSGSEERQYASYLGSGDPPCFIISKGLTVEQKVLKLFNKTKTPLFMTASLTGKLITSLEKVLKERLTPFTTAHGVLLEVFGAGLLILGESGIGKSESALDLIYRGSKLISDDVVEITKSSSGRLFGKGPRHTMHLMEIRGIGIIDIKELFGSRSVMDEREIEMVIELVQWNPEREYDRLGLEERTIPILGGELPYLQIPVSPGRNTATIIEVAVRNEKLKKKGINTAENFNSEHKKLLKKRSKK